MLATMAFALGLLVGILMTVVCYYVAMKPVKVAKPSSSGSVTSAEPMPSSSGSVTSAEPQPPPPFALYVSSAGGRFHSDKGCRGLRAATNVHKVTRCLVCGSG